MKKSKVIRILVAHNQPLVRDGLRFRIEHQADMEVVAEAGTGEEAVTRFLVQHPQVVVLDLELAQLNGLRPKDNILQSYPVASVVLMIDRNGDEDPYELLRSGAKALLFNDTSWKEALNCIRSVYRGHLILPSSVTAKLPAPIASFCLTAREIEVLKEMVDGKSNKEIGAHFQLSEGTIKTHVNHILRKLGTDGRVGACTKALKLGLVHLS